jgi:uncharacterized protein (TIGR03435 family)
MPVKGNVMVTGFGEPLDAARIKCYFLRMLRSYTHRCFWRIIAIAALPATGSYAQLSSASTAPAFEVATIKPAIPDQRGKTLTMQGHRFVTVNTTLNDLITFAYGIHPRQVQGGPAWLQTNKYDLVAEPAAAGQPSTAELRQMVQKLLADRFKLILHRDKKELPVYTITVASNGPKLTISQDDPSGLPFFSLGRGMARVKNMSISDFASLILVVVLDRPTLDKTGFTGRYDFTLKWTPDEFQFGGAESKAPPPTDDAPDLFTAMQQQLGLKLESTKARADVFVVDRVEPPSEN